MPFPAQNVQKPWRGATYVRGFNWLLTSNRLNKSSSCRQHQRSHLESQKTNTLWSIYVNLPWRLNVMSQTVKKASNAALWFCLQYWKMETLHCSVNIALSEKKQSMVVFVFVVQRGAAASVTVYSGGGGEELMVMCWRGATAAFTFPL